MERFNNNPNEVAGRGRRALGRMPLSLRKRAVAKRARRARGLNLLFRATTARSLSKKQWAAAVAACMCECVELLWRSE